jgi:hypothetical protein
VALAACATQYTPEGLTGGFDITELGQDVYRVKFSGNGYTTRETVQVYWLYRNAELDLEKGYAGFEILSNIPFVMRGGEPGEGARSMPGTLAASVPIPSSPNEVRNVPAGPSAVPSDTKSSDAREAGDRVRLAHAVPIVVYGGGGVSAPSIQADVHFIRRPVESAPPKLFNAKMLKAALEPVVKAEKCDFGNVCPHVHQYLLPKGTLH